MTLQERLRDHAHVLLGSEFGSATKTQRALDLSEAASALDTLHARNAALREALQESHSALVGLEANACNVLAFRERLGPAGWDDLTAARDAAKATYAASRALLAPAREVRG